MVGGVVADPAPWMVQLLRGRKHICAGALVSPRHVLTAAHCVQQDRPNLRLRLAEGAEHAPQHVLVHEGFDASELRHDLALLVLEQPAAVARAEMVCLPEMNGEGHEDSTALVSGWGSTGPRDRAQQEEKVRGEGSPEHREAMVRTLKRNQCEEAYLGLLDINDEKLCAAGDGVDTCQIAQKCTVDDVSIYHERFRSRFGSTFCEACRAFIFYRGGLFGCSWCITVDV